MRLTNKEIVLNTELSLAFDKENDEQFILCKTTKTILEASGHKLEDFQEYLDMEDRVLVYKSICSDTWPLEDFIKSPKYLKRGMEKNEHLNFDFVQWSQLDDMEIIAVYINCNGELYSKETYLSERA